MLLNLQKITTCRNLTGICHPKTEINLATKGTTKIEIKMSYSTGYPFKNIRYNSSKVPSGATSKSIGLVGLDAENLRNAIYSTKNELFMALDSDPELGLKLSGEKQILTKEGPVFAMKIIDETATSLTKRVDDLMDFLLQDTGANVLDLQPSDRSDPETLELLQKSLSAALKSPEVPSDYNPAASFDLDRANCPLPGRFRILEQVSSTQDALLNLLVVKRILAENRSVMKKGYVNSKDILSNPELRLLGKCCAYFLRASNLRTLSNSELPC